MKTLSMDLRERVGQAKGTGSSYEVAKRFAVHDSWVRRLWLRLKHTGSVALRKRGGKLARKIDPEGRTETEAMAPTEARPDGRGTEKELPEASQGTGE